MAREKTATKSALETLAALEKNGIKTGLTERETKFYTTGNVGVDWALGGGFAVGKLIEVNGKSGSGKTTIVTQSAVARQQSGDNVVWADFERAFDAPYAEQLGLNTAPGNGFFYFKPRSLEQGCDAIYDLVESGEVRMVVIDSIARMTTESELDGKMADLTVADKAKALYKFTRKILNSLDDNNCTLIVLNHLLEAINIKMPGVVSKLTPGGNAVPYFSSQRLEAALLKSIKPAGSSDSDAKWVGQDIQFTVTKNRFAPPSRQTVVRNNFGRGFDQVRSALEIAADLEIVSKSGAWVNINDEQLATILGKSQYQGYDNFVLAITQNAEARGRLISTALEIVKGS